MTTIGCASPARASLYWQSLLPRVGAFSAHCGNSKRLRPGQKQCLTWSFDCGAKGTRTPDPHTASVKWGVSVRLVCVVLCWWPTDYMILSLGHVG